MSELATSLRKCRVEGNTVFLPPMSDGPLANYAEVRKALLNAGAAYKRNAFVFKSDAQPFIDRLCGGENVNIKKEFQFFATPPEIADWLVELACIGADDSVLEPSAGHGAIIQAIFQRHQLHNGVDYCEIMPENLSVLYKIPNAYLLGRDFLCKEIGPYDRIIANPPFNKNQDIDHIRQMYKCLASGGRIVTVASKHWQISGNKKETEFREWLDEVNAELHDIEQGAFKDSGTMVSSVVIVIDK